MGTVSDEAALTVALLSVTVTEQLADFFPSAEVAVIVALPALTAVTFPPETVATEEFDVFQVTLCLAVEGLTVAVKVEVFPLVRLSVALLRLTLVASA